VFSEGVPGDGIPVHSVFLHCGAARELITGLKYEGRRRLASTAALLACLHARSLPGPGDLLVPVPLSPRRARERGYNQAHLLARALAEHTGARCRQVLARDERGPQVGLSRGERRRNLAGAFTAQHDLAGSGGIWLVDDVITTGATLTEAAAALGRAGAGAVSGFTMTYRSLRPDLIIAEYEASPPSSERRATR